MHKRLNDYMYAKYLIKKYGEINQDYALPYRRMVKKFEKEFNERIVLVEKELRYKFLPNFIESYYAS